jgi:hypothetical protein
MNYQAFTDDSLKMMYEAVRGVLASDDAAEAQKETPRFRIRETPDWRRHAADLEMEMIRRGVAFEIIDWSSGQATKRFHFGQSHPFRKLRLFGLLATSRPDRSM